MIREQAVEAAARAIYSHKFGPEGWEGLPDKPREQYADEARYILEAAEPFMRPDFSGSNLKAFAYEIANPLEVRNRKAAL